MNRVVIPLFAALVIVTMASFSRFMPKAKRTRLSHLDDNDPKRMNLVLNNAANVDAYYKAKGEEVEIEIVTYGPGLNMLIDGKSPVAS